MHQSPRVVDLQVPAHEDGAAGSPESAGAKAEAGGPHSETAALIPRGAQRKGGAGPNRCASSSPRPPYGSALFSHMHTWTLDPVCLSLPLPGWLSAGLGPVTLQASIHTICQLRTPRQGALPLWGNPARRSGGGWLRGVFVSLFAGGWDLGVADRKPRSGRQGCWRGKEPAVLTQMVAVGVGNECCPEGGAAPPPPRPSSGLELITAHPDPARSGRGCLRSGLVLASGRHCLCLCASLRLGPEL